MAVLLSLAMLGVGEWALGLDEAQIGDAAPRLRMMVGAVGALALALSVLLSWLVARSLVRPLGELADRVVSLIEGEPAAPRLPEEGPRETARLARRVNRLAEHLEATREELTRATATIDGEVRGRTRYLEQTNRALLDIANRDPLTGLANRRRLEIELDRQIDLARRSGNHLAVIMMDLDNFKRYNDTAGHLAGDALLLRVAEALRARTRVTDLVVRWGGDEFCILIPYTTAGRALMVARSLVEAVQEAVRTLPDAVDSLGASAGVACYPEDSEDATALIAAADAALYQVKQTGRGAVLRLGAN